MLKMIILGNKVSEMLDCSHFVHEAFEYDENYGGDGYHHHDGYSYEWESQIQGDDTYYGDGQGSRPS